MPNRFQVYETRLPKLHVWQLNDVQDLQDAMEACNTQRRDGGFTFGQWRAWGGGRMTHITSDLYLRDDALRFDTHQSGYGNSIDSSSNLAADLGDLLVVNLDRKYGIFLHQVALPLSEHDLPDFFLQPLLVEVTADEEDGDYDGPPF